MQNFKDKNVVVTGGSSGIGLATAKLFKDKGADVTITARSKELLETEAQKVGVKSVVADQSTHEGVVKLVAETIWTKVGMSENQMNELSEGVQNAVQMKRFGNADEIGKAVVFLASDEASFITGAELKVSGGFHLNTLS